MLLYTPPKAAENIPVIDLSESPDRAAKAIHRACRETGFFYVSNHGLPAELIAAQFETARTFFNLSLDAKMALHMKQAPSNAGYEPIGLQKLDSQDKKTTIAPVDLKESFYCMVDLRVDHPMSQRRIRAYGHNQWPQDLPAMRDQTLRYQAAVRGLGDRILALLARSLDLAPDWFEPYYQMPVSTVRMIRYPPQPENAEFNQIGAGAHTDWGGVTLLAQDDVGGLEVRNADGDWLVAKPMPGTFVINLGDLMAR
jgi:isopenicillin N synthase-like dioxygenase